MLSKGRDNELFAAWSEGNDPNASVFGALDPADQVLRDEPIDKDTDRAWGQIDDWADRIDGQRPIMQQEFQHAEIREAKSGFFNTGTCVPCQSAHRLHHYYPDVIRRLIASGHKNLNLNRVFVAIEAGALVRTFDGGRTWHERVRGGPHDTHTAMTHRLAPGRIYSAAGDGYFESTDAADSWSSPEDGLKHRYLVGIAADPADPNTVIVSATGGPGSAYSPRGAEAYVYRNTGEQRWEQSMSGLPAAKGTTVSRFATHAGEPGVIYAANNRGLFRSGDAGRRWKAMDLPWPEPGLADGVADLACLPE